MKHKGGPTPMQHRLAPFCLWHWNVNNYLTFCNFSVNYQTSLGYKVRFRINETRKTLATVSKDWQ